MKMQEQSQCHLDLLTMHKWVLLLKVSTMQQDSSKVKEALAGMFTAQEEQAKRLEVDVPMEEVETPDENQEKKVALSVVSKDDSLD